MKNLAFIFSLSENENENENVRGCFSVDKISRNPPLSSILSTLSDLSSFKVCDNGFDAPCSSDSSLLSS